MDNQYRASAETARRIVGEIAAELRLVSEEVFEEGSLGAALERACLREPTPPELLRSCGAEVATGCAWRMASAAIDSVGAAEMTRDLRERLHAAAAVASLRHADTSEARIRAAARQAVDSGWLDEDSPILILYVLLESHAGLAMRLLQFASGAPTSALAEANWGSNERAVGTLVEASGLHPELTSPIAALLMSITLEEEPVRDNAARSRRREEMAGLLTLFYRHIEDHGVLWTIHRCIPEYTDPNGVVPFGSWQSGDALPDMRL